jgi:hypothetical protein
MIEVRSWRPLLAGRSASSAFESIAAISEALVDPCRPLTIAADRLSLSHPDQRRNRVSLSMGRPGTAMFHAHHARAGLRADAASTAWRHLDWAIEGIDEANIEKVGLYGGLAGLAWTLRHMHRVLSLPPSADATEAFDQVLEDVVRRPSFVDVDLTKGLVGLGVYALEWLPEPRAEALLRAVVDRLAELAERDVDGVFWRVPVGFVPKTHRALAAMGYRDLGLAHGVPGVIAFLSFVHQAGIAQERARELLDGAVPWLLRQKRGSACPQRFRYWVEEAVQARVNRAAWCYGDPGIAASLVLAGMATTNPEWKAQGLDLAREIASREPSELLLTDPGLCHGAAGTAHIFNRIWHWTGDASCRDAAGYWMERVLAMRRPGQGCAGFTSAMRDAQDRPIDVADEGFLMGSAGIGLALLAAVGDGEPDWDRLLLLSGPAAARD